MKLGRLLEFHNSNHPDLGLSKNLGDGFLINKNRLFSEVRRKSIGLGFRYSDEPNANYLALPLSQLEAILRNKTIPYSDNVSVLTQIEMQHPLLTEWDDVTDNLKKNHIFHESCHTIARSYSAYYFQNSDDRDTTILRLLIEESFSNACELLGIVDVDDNAHRIFYELNSYIFMYEDRSQLKKLISDIGQPKSLKFLIGCYLFSNLLHERISETDYQSLLKVFNLGELPSSVQKTMRSVSKIAFELNPRFRWVTTTFYLKLNGLAVTTGELNSMPILNRLQKQPQFLTFLDALSQFDTFKAK